MCPTHLTQPGMHTRNTWHTGLAAGFAGAGPRSLCCVQQYLKECLQRLARALSGTEMQNRGRMAKVGEHGSAQLQDLASMAWAGLEPWVECAGRGLMGHKH